MDLEARSWIRDTQFTPDNTPMARDHVEQSLREPFAEILKQKPDSGQKHHPEKQSRDDADEDSTKWSGILVDLRDYGSVGSSRGARRHGNVSWEVHLCTISEYKWGLL